MSRTFQDDVWEFSEKFGQYRSKIPHIPPKAVQDLEIALIREEFDELIEGLNELHNARSETEALRAHAKVADSQTDLIYVILHQACAYGYDLFPVWERVHKANMKKEGGGTHENGKVKKPKGWVPPDIEGEIEQQMNKGEVCERS